MYGYSFDTETGGLLLTDAIGQTSLEPRPVYAPEMDMLGFGDHWNYERQSDVPSLGGGASCLRVRFCFGNTRHVFLGSTR